MRIINPKYFNLLNEKETFFMNKPFPHLVLDDFLEENFYEEITKKMSEKKYILKKGKSFNSEIESNKKISLNESLPEYISKITKVLNSNEWIEILKKLTGITSLKSTNVGNTLLANYHEMGTNGFLGSHVDHSTDPSNGLPHVLNIILYLSSDWKENFGGATLLYDKKGKKIVSKIKYKKNRAVVFLHTPYSFHGVERLKNNKSLKRKTLYVDYYSESMKPFENFDLDFPNKWFKHGTTFVLPKSIDYLKFKNWSYTKSLIKYKIEHLKSKL